MVKKPSPKQSTKAPAKKVAAKKAVAKKPAAKSAGTKKSPNVKRSTSEKTATKKPTAKTNGAAKRAKAAKAKTPAVKTNGAGKKAQAAIKTLAKKQAPKLSPKAMEQIGKIRSLMHENFGKVAIAMMVLPRYRNQSVADLQHMLLEPMMHDRVAIASSKATENKLEDPSAIAIWASVSKEVDTKIREQIKTSNFPIRLKENEWKSGEINWLLDVIAPNQAIAASIVGNFKQVVKGGELHVHPIVSNMIDLTSLKKKAKSN